jgi:CHAT domain-containing protein
VALQAGGRALTGPAPKSAALAAQSAGLRWLHIAGHAVYQPDDPLGSYLRLGPDDDLAARGIMGTISLRGALVTLNACTSGLSQLASGDELLGLPRALLFAGAATIVCALHDIDDIAAYTLMVFFCESLALGLSPAAALHQAQLRLRASRRHEVAALLASGFSDGERAALPALFDGDLPFGHPRYWAPFIVVGRP